MSLVGRPASLRELGRAIAGLSTRARIEITKAAAVALTSVAQQLFDSHLTVYSDARSPGDFRGAKRKAGRKRHTRGGHAIKALGSAVSLVRSGTVRGLLAFTAYGTIARVVLSTKYARYLVGRYQILPNHPTLPTTFADVLAATTEAVIRRQMGAI